METWMWITLYIVQTILGAVFLRKYQGKIGQVGESSITALIFSATVITNILTLVFTMFFLLGRLLYFIGFLAGKR
jgi:hypothetical protein